MPTAQLLTPGGKLRTVLLTREHSASSYGLPVVVVDTVALGPTETDGVLVVDDPAEAGRAEAAGYRVAMNLDEAHGLLEGVAVRAAKKSSLEARIADLEADLARALALAEGAQRAAFRINCRLEDMAANLSRAVNLEMDPYCVPGPFDVVIYEQEDGRAARIIRGEPVDDEHFHKAKV